MNHLKQNRDRDYYLAIDVTHNVTKILIVLQCIGSK